MNPSLVARLHESRAVQSSYLIATSQAYQDQQINAQLEISHVRRCLLCFAYRSSARSLTALMEARSEVRPAVAGKRWRTVR